MKRINNKRNLIIVLILLISIGFAYLSTTLNVIGTSILHSNKWEVIWDDTSVNEESSSITATLPRVDNNKTTVTYNVTLNNPGDYYEFSLDAFNNGTVDAMVSLITFTYKENNTTVTLPSVIKHTVKYADGSDIAVKDLLEAGQKQKYYINIEYDRNVTTSNMISTNRTFTVTIKIDYEQADNTAVAKVINSNTLCPNNKHLEITSNTVCKRATNLHTEICDSEKASYCISDGYTDGSEVIYGNCGTKGTLTIGDAFDCDVDGNNTFDEDERFYYVSYRDSDINSGYATLIYYKNYNTSKYSSDNNTGPTIALSKLPKSNEWTRVSLKEVQRQIKNQSGTTEGYNNQTLPVFSYTDAAARLLSLEEITNNDPSNSWTGTRALNNYRFLLENTKFTNRNKTAAFWLENIRNSTNTSAWYVSSDNRSLGSNAFNIDNNLGVRPAIEVPLKNIAY